MAEGRYIVTHSNYTIKKKHKILKDDTIFERDYMTTTNLGGFDSGSIPYGEGNFRIVYNKEKNLKRKHKYGNWLKNENCIEGDVDNCEVFTMKNMPTQTSAITSEGKIVIKPKKNSFLDFVYYGSAQEMFRSAIDDIIVKFPAELYVTDENYVYLDSNNEERILGGEDWVVIENPFDIDIYSSTPSVSQKNDVKYNPLRFFSESVSKYRIIDTDEESYHIDTWEVLPRNKSCYNDGDITDVIVLNSGQPDEMIIRRYFKDNSFVLLTDKTLVGYRIRPIDSVIDDFFTGLNEFERFLLNKDTDPLYSITIDTPRENEEGVYFVEKTYTWPLENGYNTDISSYYFELYYKDIMDICTWYDENRVDNLWRNMTHDSIKNMDHTHTNTGKNEGIEDYREGTELIHAILNVIARQFDDIKMSIDNIKTINTITYNEDNNTPDYFLTDTLELSGWDVKSAVETLDPEARVTKLFDNSNKEYTTNDANVQFFRNLKLNSRALFSRKGTREAIEMLLSLFGLCSYDWAKKYYDTMSNNKKTKIGRRVLKWDDLEEEEKLKLYDYSLDEYVVTITGGTNGIVNYEDDLDVEKYSIYRKDFEAPDDGNILHGLPVRIVTIITEENGEEVKKKYMIPWFSKKDNLEGGLYFQMFGGWGKRLKKDVTPDKELYPNVTEIETISGFTIYEETKKYLKIVNTLGDLKKLDIDDVNNGDIFYVNDLFDVNDNITDYYPDIVVSAITNYFTIEDHNNIDIYGTNDSGITGWVNILKDELSAPNVNGYKVIYLESIIETNKGNNPHIGHGYYDNGEEFLNYIRQVFRGAIKGNGFTDEVYDCEDGNLISAITECGFAVRDSVVDNVKTWYFADATTNKKIYRLTQDTDIIYDEEGNKHETQNGYKKLEITEKINVGKTAYNNGEVGFKSELSAFNLETITDGDNGEAAANSIINIKKLVLKFNNKYVLEKSFNDYLYKVILPYVNQLVPSTALFEVILDNR